jgi:hypothetical protein
LPEHVEQIGQQWLALCDVKWVIDGQELFASCCSYVVAVHVSRTVRMIPQFG